MWHPIETLPHNGKDFLACNKMTKECMVVNCPKGHAIGRWTKDGKLWVGSFVSFKPTHWTKLPKSI